MSTREDDERDDDWTNDCHDDEIPRIYILISHGIGFASSGLSQSGFSQWSRYERPQLGLIIRRARAFKSASSVTSSASN